MNNHADLRNILTDVYGISATPITELMHMDLSAVTVYTHFPDKYTLENYGKFDMQQFESGSGELYNLVICEDDFTVSQRLLEAMRDQEMRDVKKYEFVAQSKRLPGYFLYKLVPYTVQGKPVWY